MPSRSTSAATSLGSAGPLWPSWGAPPPPRCARRSPRRARGKQCPMRNRWGKKVEKTMGKCWKCWKSLVFICSFRWLKKWWLLRVNELTLNGLEMDFGWWILTLYGLYIVYMHICALYVFICIHYGTNMVVHWVYNGDISTITIQYHFAYSGRLIPSWTSAGR